MTYTCSVCSYKTRSLVGYVAHYKLHQNVANLSFPCGVVNCCRSFNTYSAFNVHVTRDHIDVRKSSATNYLSPDLELKCPVEVCQQHLSSIGDLLKHLRTHISEDEIQIACPFASCERQYRNASSFKSHISRCHTTRDLSEISKDLVVHIGHRHDCSGLTPTVLNDPAADTSGTPEVESMDVDEGNPDDEHLFLDNMALFYLKLLSKHHVPANTIQLFIEEVGGMHTISQGLLRDNLGHKLISAGMDGKIVQEIINDVFDKDMFSRSHNITTGPLRSDHIRKSLFKLSFNYVTPECISLGRDGMNKAAFYHYAPIKETLCVLLRDKGVLDQYKSPRPIKDGIYSDVSDGSAVQNNELFKSTPDSLKLLLYQDQFEVVNPLGSAKTKHKILAVYLTLGNLYPECRSKIDALQLVLLGKDKYLGHFGPGKVFARMLADIRDLEDNGIEVEGIERVRGSIAFVLGDNLGSHSIGGFSCGFITPAPQGTYPCRWCLVTRPDLDSGHGDGEKFTSRIPENYALSVTQAQVDEVPEHKGVKFDSPFNTLNYFHVCAPGLPPCIAHDLFEGVVQYDLAMYINHMVKKKWFSHEYLNVKLDKFQFVGMEARDKLSSVNIKGDKIGGHACQNWCFLRFLPLLIGEKIEDVNDPVWELVILLHRLVQLVSAPQISIAQIVLLKTVIDEYLFLRLRLFPETKLRPKHHYLTHYPKLIMECGPLIRLWTMRFESKHSYFKRCMRCVQNFKNVTQTLSERHQPLQAYYSHGSFFPSKTSADKFSTLLVNLLHPELQNAINDCPRLLGKTIFACDKITVAGTNYQRGQAVVLAVKEGRLSLGETILTLLIDDTAFVVLEKLSCNYLADMNLYEVGPQEHRDYVCMEIQDLHDYCPLSVYDQSNRRFVVLKHAVLD